MIEKIELVGSISSGGLSLTGGITSSSVEIVDVEVKEHYLDNTTLYIVLTNYQTLSLDVSQYFGNTLTAEQTEAINNMTCEIDNNGCLLINYDDTILAINFKIENGELIAEIDNDNINSDGEMEAIY